MKIRIAEIAHYKDMPIAVLVASEESQKRSYRMHEIDKIVGYLSPFRGYCFQVSGTFEGEGDLGASIVIGLGNIWAAIKHPSNNILTSSNLDWQSSKVELIKGQACIALMEFASRRGMVLDVFGGFEDITMSDGSRGLCRIGLDHYIKEVEIWLKHRFDE